MDEEKLMEVVGDEELDDVISDWDLQFFIENDNQECYYNEYECFLVNNLN